MIDSLGIIFSLILLSTLTFVLGWQHSDNSHFMDRDTKLEILVGEHQFTAILVDNPTTAKFTKSLPLKITMKELNRNEKYADLEESLPTTPIHPQRIEPGDLMLFGDRTLVLFYKGFSTPYRYTRLGKIADPAGLSKALGPEDIEIEFRME